jgi:hypothetical protein
MKNNFRCLITVLESFCRRIFRACLVLLSILTIGSLQQSYAQIFVAGGVTKEASSKVQEVRNVLPEKPQVSVFPNPASITAKIYYELPFDSHVSIKLYDVMGRHIFTIVDANYNAGCYSREFYVSTLQPGMYFYQLVINSKNKIALETGKINVIK